MGGDLERGDRWETGGRREDDLDSCGMEGEDEGTTGKRRDQNKMQNKENKLKEN